MRIQSDKTWESALKKQRKSLKNARYRDDYLQAKYNLLAFAPTFEEVVTTDRDWMKENTGEGEDEG